MALDDRLNCKIAFRDPVHSSDHGKDPPSRKPAALNGYVAWRYKGSLQLRYFVARCLLYSECIMSQVRLKAKEKTNG